MHVAEVFAFFYSVFDLQFLFASITNALLKWAVLFSKLPVISVLIKLHFIVGKYFSEFLSFFLSDYPLHFVKQLRNWSSSTKYKL